MFVAMASEKIVRRELLSTRRRALGHDPVLFKLFLLRFLFLQLLRGNPFGLAPLSSLYVVPTLLNLIILHGPSARSRTDLFGFSSLLFRHSLCTPLLAALDVVDIQPFDLFFSLQTELLMSRRSNRRAGRSLMTRCTIPVWTSRPCASNG